MGGGAKEYFLFSRGRGGCFSLFEIFNSKEFLVPHQMKQVACKRKVKIEPIFAVKLLCQLCRTS